MKIRLWLVAFFAIVFLAGCTTGKQAFKKGEKQYKLGEYEFAIASYATAIEKNYAIADANYKIAESYRQSNRIDRAEIFYEKSIEAGEEDEMVYIHYANAKKSQAKYGEAKTILSDYVGKAENQDIADLAQKELTNLVDIEELLDKDSYYRVKNLDRLNTAGAEYSPVYFNGKLYFTSNRFGGKLYSATGTPFTNIYEASTKGAVVDTTTITPLKNGFNTPVANEGTIAISPDGSIMIFAKGNSGKRKDGEDVDLYISRYRRNQWTVPQPMRINDPKAWDSSPAFTNDGRSIIFASNRKGSIGGTDLYMATMNSRGRFTNVRNLGNVINTEGNEMFPHMASDGSLYFASDGHPNMGEMDIFVAKRSSGKLNVINLGPPINSNKDDFGIYLFSPTKGFFCSNRDGGSGDDDIYTFINRDPNLKIVNYYLAGTTVTLDDGDNEIILPNTVVKLFSAQTDELLSEAVTNANARFTFRVYPEEDYYIVASKEEYLTSRNAFTTVGKSIPKENLKVLETNKTFQTKIELNKIVLDKAFVLENIYYDLDKWNIRADAAKELDKLVTVLIDNPEIKIELSSHTDSRQTAEYNLDLSKKRAQSAVDYIVATGIDPERITAKGYGESQLLISDADINKIPNEEAREVAHQRNRRTEFKILSYDRSKSVVVQEEGELTLEESLEAEDDLENRIDWDN